MNKNYYAYLRVASLDQRDQHKSFLAQRRAITRYAKRNRLTITKWFKDHGSGIGPTRPGLRRVIADLRARKVHGLIIERPERLTRSMSALVGLRRRGIEIHITDPNWHPDFLITP